MVNNLLFLLLLFFASSCYGTTFYVDPDSGDIENDGSESSPWSTLQEVWTSGKISTTYTAGGTVYQKNPSGPVKPGDTIVLLSGYHGTLSMTGARNTVKITVKAANGATPYLHKIYGLGVENWEFDGVTITPSADPTYTGGSPSTLFYIESNSWYGASKNITLKNSTLYTISDSSSWTTASDWTDNAYSGVVSMAESTVVDGCLIKNVGGGVRFANDDYPANNSYLTNTTIDKTSQDPVWVFYSDDVTIQGNVIKNVVGVLDRLIYHYDLIQAASADYLTIKNNILIANEDGGVPPTLVANCQGIGAFDGWYNNATIENNVVSINSYHGISVYGAINSRVVNNTVVYNPYNYWDGGPSSAQIGFFDHKTAGAGSGNILSNNICTSVRSISTGTTATNNLQLNFSDYTDTFTDAGSFYYFLITDATAINAGSTTYAPPLDILGNTRDAQPDIGAYEYGGVYVPPTQAGARFRNLRFISAEE